MTKTIGLFFSIFLSGLMAGTTYWVWLTGNPAELSYPTFLESFQAEILAVRGPILVVATPGLAFIAWTVWLMRNERPRVYFVITALALYVVASLSTRLGNIPINEQVLTWSESAPADWQDVMGRWWLWHQTRTLAMNAAFVLLIGVALWRKQSVTSSGA
jgi:uncharacterized membrane protein